MTRRRRRYRLQAGHELRPGDRVIYESGGRTAPGHYVGEHRGSPAQLRQIVLRIGGEGDQSAREIVIPATQVVRVEQRPSGLRRLWPAWLPGTPPQSWVGWATIIGAIVAVVVAGAAAWRWLGGGGAADDAPPAVHITANADLITSGGTPLGGSYVVPRSIDDIPAPPDEGGTCVGRYEWAHRLGGIDADSTAVLVTLTGRSTLPLALNHIDIEEGPKGFPALGSFITCGGQGGGLPVFRIHLDLWRTKRPTYWFEGVKGGRQDEFSLTIARNEQVQLLLLTKAHDCDCRWKVALPFVTGGGELSLEISDRGRFFRTTSPRNAPSFIRLGRAWRKT